MLWGRVHRLPWRAWEVAIIDQSSREVLDVASERISTYLWGEGKHTILLVHGWDSRASHFKKHIEHLTHMGYRIAGFDAIGHGHSSGKWASVADFQAALQAMNKRYGPFHTIIGHSFGGFCIPYALNHGVRAERAVLIATPDTLEWLFERFTRILQAPEPVRLAMKQLIEQRFGDDCWVRYSVAQNANRLGHIPALIVHDENDPGVPLELAQVIQEAWPQSRLVITKRLGHHRVLRHPSAINPVIEFIQD